MPSSFDFYCELKSPRDEELGRPQARGNNFVLPTSWRLTWFICLSLIRFISPIVSFCCGSKAGLGHHPIMPFLPFNCWVNQKRRHSQGGITTRRFMARVSPSLEAERPNSKVDPCTVADQPLHIIHLGYRNKEKNCPLHARRFLFNYIKS